MITSLLVGMLTCLDAIRTAYGRVEPKNGRLDVMLEYLTLTNIKKHKSLTLNFVDGINVIVGITESGKTAALKGLLWGLKNMSTGVRLVNHDANSCAVEIGLDSNVITRSWSKSSNQFKLNDKEFEAFKTDVPVEIKALVNLEDINIQKRRDMPFMVHAKDTDNAEMFSKMLDLDEINTVITNSNAFVKDGKKDKSEAEVEHTALSKSLEKYKDIDTAKTELDSIFASIDILNVNLTEIQNLKALLDDYRSNKTQLQQWEGIADAISELQTLSVAATKLSTLSKSLLELQEWQRRYQVVSENLNIYKDAPKAQAGLELLSAPLSQLSELEDSIRTDAKLRDKLTQAEVSAKKFMGLNVAEKSLNAYVKESVHASNVRNQVKELSSLKRAYNECRNSVEKQKLNLESAEASLKEIMPEVCPLCKKPIGECND